MAIITISRGSMSGGKALAQCLGTSLGYPVLAREVLVEAAAKLGVPEEVLKEKIQTTLGVFTRLREDRRIYLLALQSALADHCISGNLVYHGNAGHFLLKSLPAVLRVRLIAPMSVRIRAVAERRGLNPESAREYIAYVDQERIEWSRFVYGVDWRDPKNYDIVINLRQVSIETACVMISSVVRLPSYGMTPEVAKTLHNFALGCRVQVALAVDPRLQGIKFDARAEGGGVEITGEQSEADVQLDPAESVAEEIKRIAKAVEGVKEVKVSFRNHGEVVSCQPGRTS
jgi:cytidylate kinase